MPNFCHFLVLGILGCFPRLVLQKPKFSTYSFAFSTDYPMIPLASFFALDNQWKKQRYRWKNYVFVKLA